MHGAAAAVPPRGPFGAPELPWVLLPPPREALARLARAVADAVRPDAVRPGVALTSPAEVLDPNLGRSRRAPYLRPVPGSGPAGDGPTPDGPTPAGPGGPDPDGSGVETEHREVWTVVERAAAGDGAAFGELYDRYVDIVYRYVYYRVADRGLAEDLTSETFLRALRRIGSISYQGRDIGAWLVTIARNLILDHVKSARARLETTTDEIGLVGDYAASSPGPASPETLVIDAMTSARLMAAVDELNVEQRECVLLRFVQGFSVSETAAIMGKNDGAIKALQHRAVRKLATIVGAEL